MAILTFISGLCAGFFVGQAYRDAGNDPKATVKELVDRIKKAI